MSILNNTTEGRESASPETPMADIPARPRNRAPTHPGAILARELDELGITPYAAEPLLGVTRQNLGNIIKGNSAVTPDMALRLGKFFGNGPELWMGLQVDYDLWTTKQKIADDLAKIKRAKKSA